MRGINSSCTRGIYHYSATATTTAAAAALTTYGDRYELGTSITIICCPTIEEGVRGGEGKKGNSHVHVIRQPDVSATANISRTGVGAAAVAATTVVLAAGQPFFSFG